LGSASAAKLPTYHLAMKGNPMTTYEDAKKEFEDEIAKTLAHVKHIKETKTFDFLCPQCKKVKKILVLRMKQGRQGLKYCCVNCRAAAHRDRKKAETDNIIQVLKDRIEELESKQ